jgi:Rab3 GTPase-activating protein catalytic subunit
METAIHSPPCNEPVEATVVPTVARGATDVLSEINFELPEPIPLLEFEKITMRKVLDDHHQQYGKGENLGNFMTRIFEVKTSLFEKKHSRPFAAEEDRRPISTVSGEWTFV